MKKTVFTVVAIMVMIAINVTAGALIFLDIQFFQTPETTIRIDLIEVNLVEAVIKLTVEMTNPNHFELLIKNLELITFTDTGGKTVQTLIKDEHVSPLESKVFTATAHVGFNGATPGFLRSKLTGAVGVNLLGFIKKTLPLDISIITSVENVIQSLSSPILHVEADFKEVTQESVNISVKVDVYNPNTFEIYVESFLVNVETETGENLGNLVIKGGEIAAKSSLIYNGTGRILFKALESKRLMINVSGAAGAKVASINKSIPFYVDAQIKTPDLDTLLSDMSMDAVIRGDYKASLNGLIDYITFEVNNPHKITFLARNITVRLYRVDDDEECLIAEESLGEGIIKAQDVSSFNGKLVVPYPKLLPLKGGRLIPDGLKVAVKADVVLPVFNYSVQLGVVGYQDLRPFN